LNGDGLGALRALRTAALRLKTANPELREATAQERSELELAPFPLTPRF
jgi:hypothetical protein